MADERLSNVIGAPFAEHVLTQLNTRAVHNSTGKGADPIRTADEVLFLANKSAWVKLSSSVRIEDKDGKSLREFYKKLELGANFTKPDDLAKNWLLAAGTSEANGSGINLRKGLGENGAYGLGGTMELGYRPMPGLTSVTVDTKGTLGSLREATINFKVWNMNQLNVIEALYFRLGYSMLLEWGHTQFYSNVNQTGGTRLGTFTTNTYGIDPFQKYRKEILQQILAKRGRELSGNYDAMWGIVTNFSWSFNQDGGYDCFVKIIGLGAIIDSLRINLSYKMPDILFQEYSQQQKTIQEQQEIDAANAAKQKENQQRREQNLPPLPEVPINSSEIYTKIYTADLGTPNPPDNERDFLNRIAIYPAYTTDLTRASFAYDYYYKATTGGNPQNNTFVGELNRSRTGLFLNQITNLRPSWQVLFADAPSPVVLSLGQLNLFAVRVIGFANDTTANSRFAVSDPWTGGTYDNKDLNDALGSDTFVKLFDLVVRDSRGKGVGGFFSNLTNQEIDPEEKVDVDASVTLQYPGLIINPDGQTKTRFYFVKISYRALIPNETLVGTTTVTDAQAAANQPTRRELTEAIQRWFSSGRKINITSMNKVLLPNGTDSDIIISGTALEISIPNKVAPLITIEFNNTALIQTVLPPLPPEGAPVPQQTQEGNSGDAGGAENTATTDQTDQAQRFASSLHAMLSAVKSQLQYKAGTVPQSEGVFTESLITLTTTMFRDGVLDGVLTQDQTPSNSSDGEPFNLLRYALKGFNSNLMADPRLYNKIEFVDFNELCTAYGIRYTIKDEESSLNFPIYIKLGYLMAFLNSMCLIYDSTEDTNKHPYVYLDFNPATNFCLTMPQHLSVDPFVCMIPFQGTQNDYLKIFPSELTGSLQGEIAKTGNLLFGPEYNAASSYIDSFKTEGNAYQGKTMEILLNVDFLLNTLNQYTTNDSEHVVNLKGFLDAIVTGINKSTGNINLFRVAYRDDSNTVIIKDDQFVPPKDGEAYMLDRNKYIQNGPYNVPKYGQLPVFGLQSLVREMEFKTNMSTKMASVIAISAQAGVGSANSSDYSYLSYLNVNFVDAYKPKITDSTENVKSPTADVTGSVANDLNQAIQFNAHVLSLYYGLEYVLKPRVESATNYYINQMAGVKSTDGITVAAPFIPANLSLTIDGISGIVMGNAFTIPENRLPISLRGTGDTTKVGFVVVGLTHTIENNQWLTKIRGQMIRLRDSTEYSAPAATKRIQTAFPLEGVTTPTAEGSTGVVVNTNQDWVGIAYDFIASKEGFLSQAKFDVNAYRGGYGSDFIVREDGSLEKVTSTTTFTRADAERTLKQIIVTRFQFDVIGQIGQDKWNSLNDKQKAALVSYAYNAGGGALKTWKIAQAIKANSSPQQIAQLIQAGPITAKGEVLEGLVTRRKDEARLYLS